MGKRSSFERKPRDYYRTFDKRALVPLIPFLGNYTCYCEPCAGAGDLAKQLDKHIMCYWKSDVDPQEDGINKIDALCLTTPLKWCGENGGCIITNPPWDVKLLHPMIDHFKSFADTWLLFYADWAYTKQAKPYMKYCHAILPVGRLCWQYGTKTSGKDNVSWYLFKKQENNGFTKFYGE